MSDIFLPRHLVLHGDHVVPGGRAVPGPLEHLRPGHLHHQHHPRHPHSPQLRLLEVHVWPDTSRLRAETGEAKKVRSSPQRSSANDVGKMKTEARITINIYQCTTDRIIVLISEAMRAEVMR